MEESGIKTIKARCKACKQETVWFKVDTQSKEGLLPLTVEYRCMGCGGTRFESEGWWLAGM